MGSLRFLLLAALRDSTAYGLSARRLARMLRVKPSTLAYHLDALESAGFIVRAPWEIYDQRKVAVRLTSRGRHALDHLCDAVPEPSQPAMRSPAIARP